MATTNYETKDNKRNEKKELLVILTVKNIQQYFKIKCLAVHVTIPAIEAQGYVPSNRQKTGRSGHHFSHLHHRISHTELVISSMMSGFEASYWCFLNSSPYFL